MTYTLAGVDLGDVESEAYGKQSNLLTIAMPDADDDETLAFDFAGVTSTIRISGTKTFTTQAAAAAFEDSLRALVDGQQIPVDYVSDWFGTIQVMVLDVNPSHSTNSELIVLYEIVLTRASNDSGSTANL